MDTFQFYATPPELCKKVWAKFQNRQFSRVLEPSAGHGDLALAHPSNHADYMHRHVLLPECCEIDVSKHDILRAKGLKVVGMDFLKFTSGAHFSHIVGNPPFHDGVKHVLKAWDILWDGECCMIINAESVRNPYTQERRFLMDLIEQHGSVEIIEGAFMVEEAERKTAVDVAIVYLRKKANVNQELFAPVFDDLKVDEMTASGLTAGYRDAKELALANSTIDNMVTAFNAAVKTMREAIFLEARARYFARLLGDTMSARCGETTDTESLSIEYVQKTVAERYAILKDRAWASVLRSANVTGKLSSAAQKRVESEFEKLKSLEFTSVTILGFLCGIVDSQTDIQLQMCCDVFDLVSRYHSDNVELYRGWKSNSKHRTAGRKIKMTRFILPGHRTESYSHNISWESRQLLSDIDKVFFCLLEGKAEVGYGLAQMFAQHFNELRAGERVESEHFSCRYFPGVGTIHFFPKQAKLIERLNKLVGFHRGWLPPPEARVDESFWLQYDASARLDKEYRKQINKASRSCRDNPLRQMDCDDRGDTTYGSEAHVALDSAMNMVQERHGLHVNFLLKGDDVDSPLLLKAA